MSVLIPPTGLLPPTTPGPPETIRAWLASAHPTPSRARMEWTGDGRLAMLPCGSVFGAVRIPGSIVHAAVGTSDRWTVADVLGRTLRGPVIHDFGTVVGPTYYALLPWSPDSDWPTRTDTPLLGPETYLGVPDINRTEPPGSYWVRPPLRARDFCRRGALFDMIGRGRHALRQLAEEANSDADAPTS